MVRNHESYQIIEPNDIGGNVALHISRQFSAPYTGNVFVEGRTDKYGAIDGEVEGVGVIFCRLFDMAVPPINKRA